MNKQLFFLIIACSLFVLSIIAINVAPIISKSSHDDYFDDWANDNCQQLEDDYKYHKDNHYFDPPKTKADEEDVKKGIDKCKRHKVMYGLEYSAFVIDVSLGFICSFLSLFHFLEPGKPLEKVSGFIGIFAGIITAVITIIFLVFNGLIFSNEHVGIEILYPNKASLKYNGAKYVYDYDYDKLEDDHDIRYIKYKDLGKKQYNYDSEIYKALTYYSDTEYEKCQVSDIIVFYTTQDGKKKQYTVDTTNVHNCDYIWKADFQNENNYNKYLYDRWMTCIILSALIALCGIGLVIFGFLLSKSEGDSGSSPIPQ